MRFMNKLLTNDLWFRKDGTHATSPGHLNYILSPHYICRLLPSSSILQRLLRPPWTLRVLYHAIIPGESSPHATWCTSPSGTTCSKSGPSKSRTPNSMTSSQPFSVLLEGNKIRLVSGETSITPQGHEVVLEGCIHWARPNRSYLRL